MATVGILQRHGEVLVPLSELDRAQLQAEAVRRNLQLGSRGSYGESSVQRHIVGLLGEHAVAAWLCSIGAAVRLIGDDAQSQRTGAGDLIASFDPPEGTARAALLEVKTQRARHYAQPGPEMNLKQLMDLEADAVVWCVVGDAPWSCPVRIVGWFQHREVRRNLAEDSFSDAYRRGGGVKVVPGADGSLDDLIKLIRAVRHDPPATTPFD